MIVIIICIICILGPRLKNFLQSQKIEPAVRKRGTKYDALSTSPEKLTGYRKKLKKNDGPGNSMGSRSGHQEKKKLSILKQGTPSPDPLVILMCIIIPYLSHY